MGLNNITFFTFQIEWILPLYRGTLILLASLCLFLCLSLTLLSTYMCYKTKCQHLRKKPDSTNPANIELDLQTLPTPTSSEQFRDPRFGQRSCRTFTGKKIHLRNLMWPFLQEEIQYTLCNHKVQGQHLLQQHLTLFHRSYLHTTKVK